MRVGRWFGRCHDWSSSRRASRAGRAHVGPSHGRDRGHCRHAVSEQSGHELWRLSRDVQGETVVHPMLWCGGISVRSRRTIAVPRRSGMSTLIRRRSNTVPMNRDRTQGCSGPLPQRVRHARLRKRLAWRRQLIYQGLFERMRGIEPPYSAWETEVRPTSRQGCDMGKRALCW
jgi:hypothetical protein